MNHLRTPFATSPSRIGSSPLLAVLLAAMIQFSATRATAEDLSPRHDALIADLGHDDFDRREAATKALVADGTAALPAVRLALASTDAEVTTRGFRILQTWFVDGDPATAGVATDLIDELRLSTDPALSGWSRQLLASYSDVAATRAIEKIRSLGGECEPSRNSFNIVRPNVPLDSQFKDILLGEDWKGGTEGLKYLRRIGGISVLYVTPGSGLATDVVDNLAKDLNGAAVQWRGSGMLGITREPSEEFGVTIGEVRPGGPADQVGVQQGDLIVLYQGEEITQFQKVIDITRPLKSTEIVELVVLRDDELHTFRFPLQKFTIAPPPGQQTEPRLRIR
jgi:hypothetical protein